MYQEPGLAWLERQAEVAEDLGHPSRRSEQQPVGGLVGGR
jgi:hypothetical protein